MFLFGRKIIYFSQMFQLHRLVVRTLGPAVYRTSFSTSTVPKAVNPTNKKSDSELPKKSEVKKTKSKFFRVPVCYVCVAKHLRLSDPMVAAAFDSLQAKGDEVPDVKMDKSKLDEIDERIVNAKTVQGLLSVAENSTGMTRKQALKVSITLFHHSRNR